MDKAAIITILITASIAIAVGLIFWYVIVPETNTTIIITNNNPVPPNVVDIAFGLIPIAVIAFFMMIIIYTVKSGTFE